MIHMAHLEHQIPFGDKDFGPTKAYSGDLWFSALTHSNPACVVCKLSRFCYCKEKAKGESDGKENVKGCSAGIACKENVKGRFASSRRQGVM